MNTQEATAILKIIKVSYPFAYKDFTQKQVEETIEVWAMMFEGDDIKLVTEAVKSYICANNPYPPVIGQIKELMRTITKTECMTEMQAWSMVYKAICNSGYNSVESFEKLPLNLQKLVGSAKQLKDWALTGNLNMEVIQSNFMRSYKAMKERNEMISRLPDSSKNLMDGGKDKCLTVKNVTEEAI